MEDPFVDEDMKRQLDEVYNVLFTSYKEDYNDYVAEAERLKTRIAAFKPPAPMAFRPYPKMTDKAFNDKIYVKKEFNRNKLEKEYGDRTYEEIANAKCSLTDFKLTNNQKFLKNFMSPLTPYNGLLLFHSVGVGKTCTAISIAEQYMNEFLDHKKVLVILSSNIKDNFKKQIFDMTRYDVVTGQSTLCTGTKYPDMVLDKDILSKETLEKRIKNIIKERYQFIGYKELVFMLSKIMDNVKRQEKNESKHQQRFEQKVTDIFSNRLIIVDEAHNLRLPSEQGKKQVANTLLQILQLAQNTKLVLLTATPMFDNAYEIVWLLNLLLTNDKRPNIKTKDIFKNGELTDKGRQELIKATRGYVSYMRGENPFSFPFRLYPSVNKDNQVITSFPSKDAQGHVIPPEQLIKYMEIVGSPMSDYQKQMYELLKKHVVLNPDLEDDEDDEVKNDVEQKSKNELQNILQLSNVTYPNTYDNVRKTYGEEGFLTCFQMEESRKNERKGVTYTKACKATFGEVLAFDNIQKYSPKIKSILDYIINSKGIVFIYSQYYYSGIYPLAIALEHIGFTKYNSKNITNDITVDNKFAHLDKRPTYTIISRDKFLSPNNDQCINAARSSANANGDLIKVIIVSKVGTEGIDFKFIREVHILEPWFNMNRMEQIVGRAVRTCSHVKLPTSERNVTIYMHATSYNQDEESIDIKTYRVAEQKQMRIIHVQRLLKENAIDCLLNEATHVYPKDKVGMTLDITTSQGKRVPHYQVGDADYSYICDFGKCELKCASTTTTTRKPDTSTYHPFFLIDDIDVYKKYVAHAFWNVHENTYEDIRHLIQEYVDEVDHDVLSFAIQEMVDTKYKFKNIHGASGYLIYRGNTYIFQNEKYYETKLTLEERKDVGRMSKLDFDVLRHQSKSHKTKATNIEIQQSPTKPTKQSKLKKNTSPSKTTHMHVADMSQFQQKYETLMSILGQKYDAYALEYMLDRVDLQTLKYIIFTEELPPFAHKLKVALLRSPFVHVEHGKVAYVYVHQDEFFYAVKDGDLKRVGMLERQRATAIISGIESKLAYTDNGFKGYVQKVKDGLAFKVRDNIKSKGYVCHQTSSLTLGDLKQRIRDIEASINLEDSAVTKKLLCDIYEIVLRSQGKDVFKRPIYKN